MSRFCSHCGSPMNDTDKFCIACGTKAANPVPSPTAQPAATPNVQPAAPNVQTPPPVYSQPSTPNVQTPPPAYSQPATPNAQTPPPAYNQPSGQVGTVNPDGKVIVDARQGTPFVRREYEGDLIINKEAKGYIDSFCKWVKFIAIFGLVMLTLYSISMLVSTITVSKYLKSASPAYIIGLVISILVIVIGYVILIRTLKMQGNFRDALQRGNEKSVTEAFFNLKFLAKTSGIMTIVSIALFVIALIIGASARMF